MKREHLEILYQILATMGRVEMRKAAAHGLSPEEIVEATLALSNEVEGDPLFAPEDFEDHLPEGNPSDSLSD